MAKRKDNEVKQLKMERQQMEAVLRRTSANVKNWAVWKDPKAIAQKRPVNK